MAKGWIALFFFAGVVGWFYAWMPPPAGHPRMTSEPLEPYQDLAASLLKGHAYLIREPPRELGQLPNPYDPVQNAPYRTRDLSYFNGHYYLYLGIAPALFFFAPVRLLAGAFPMESFAVVVFCALGVAAATGLLASLRRRFYPGCPPLLLGCAVSMLAVADGYYVVVRGVISNHVAIAAAYAFSMLALAAGSHALVSRRAATWLGLASMGFGLSVASRPNYVFASVGALALLWMGCARAGTPARSRERWIGAAAATLPFGAVVLGLLWYNAARFGQPLEFGARFVLGGWDQTQLHSSSLGSVGPNAARYLFKIPALSPYFPFETAPDELATGVLPTVPWLWLTPLAMLAVARRACTTPVRTVALAALLLGTVNLLTLLFLPSGNPSAILTSANRRYVFDFLPSLVLFASIGVMALGSETPAGSVRRRILVASALGLALVSGLAALSLDFQFFPVESYLPLACGLNLPTALYERMRGLGYGPVSFVVEFPRGRAGHTEPLLDTGRLGASDLVFVRYVGDRSVRFGLQSDGEGGPLGEPVAIDFSTPHNLEIWLGSLFPPRGHPAFAGLTGTQATIAKRRVRVVMDGRIVLDDIAGTHPAAPGEVWEGSNPAMPGFGSPVFSGKISGIQRLPLSIPAAEIPAPSYGAVHMLLRLPAGRTGAQEPLVVTGHSGAGDFVYVDYLGPDRIRIGFDHWGKAAVESRILSVDFSRDHTVDVFLGSLSSGSAESGPPERPGNQGMMDCGVRVLFDGAVMISADCDTFPSSPYEVAVGRNPIGGSSCGYAFTGMIRNVRRPAN